MRKDGKKILNENIYHTPGGVTLGMLLGKTTTGFDQGMQSRMAAKGDDTYIKFIQPNPKFESQTAKTLTQAQFSAFNVNSQVNLEEDLSQIEIIIEPEQSAETKTGQLMSDFLEVYKKVSNEVSEAKAISLPVKLKNNQDNGAITDIEFIYSQSPDANVIFVADPAVIKAKDYNKNMEAALAYACKFAKEQSGQALIDDEHANTLFANNHGLTVGIQQALKKFIGSSSTDKTADEWEEFFETPEYENYVKFSNGLFNLANLLTVDKSITAKYFEELHAVNEIIQAQFKPQNNSIEANPDDSSTPADSTTKQAGSPSPETNGTEQKDDETKPEAKPVKPLTINIIEDKSITPGTCFTVSQLYSQLQKAGKACIISPAPLATVKMMIGGLPQQAANAITSVTNGLDLVYVKADTGKPVMLASDPTKLDKKNLYNQVVHQLSDWYIIVPDPKQAKPVRLIFYFKKKGHKAILELKSFKPEIPLHICKLSGNKWISEFYTEQNTLNKQGCRTILWSTNASVFGNSAVQSGTGAQPSATTVQQTQTAQSQKPVISQAEQQKRKYIIEVISDRIDNLLFPIHGKTMKIHSPVLDKAGNVIIPCNGGWHKITEKEWAKLIQNFDNIKDFSPFGPAWNIYVKKLTACFDISSINTAQFDVEEPLPEEQEKTVKQLGDLFVKEFNDFGLEGIEFQVIAPGRKPKYSINTAIMQGKGWIPQQAYTLTVMIPGVDETKLFGQNAVNALNDFGIGEVQHILNSINKNQTEKLGLAVVMDNGFPS